MISELRVKFGTQPMLVRQFRLGDDFLAEFGCGRCRYDTIGMTPFKPLHIPADADGNQRAGKDRRQRPVLPPLFPVHRRRRTSGRRLADPAGYVDIYDGRTWGVAISILLLSTLDAILTGIQIGNGFFREANPLMNAVLIHGGVYSFLSVKLAMTAIPLAIIVLHKEWAVARFAARLCLWAYILLSLYHIYLILLLKR